MRFLQVPVLIALLLVTVLLPVWRLQAQDSFIYIRADGAIEPANGQISTFDNITYVLTGNINSSVVVERQGIVLDGQGFKIEGSGAFESKGITVSEVSNVTIKRVNVDNFVYGMLMNSTQNATISSNTLTNCSEAGILLVGNTNNPEPYPQTFYHSFHDNNISNCTRDGMVFAGLWNSSIVNNTVNAVGRGGIVFDGCANNIVTGNNVTNCGDVGFDISYAYVSGVNAGLNNVSGNVFKGNAHGMAILTSDNNTIGKNEVTSNNYTGIIIAGGSSFNTIELNNVALNGQAGIDITAAFNNTFTENSVTNNTYGISLSDCSGNLIYHNDLVNNTYQAVTYSAGVNIWENGTVGNFWSDYRSRYPNATEIDATGVWDTPYVIDANNLDHYPLVPEFPSVVILLLLLLFALGLLVFARKRSLHPLTQT